MSSPEVERFEVTDEDYANEFNPNRKRFKMSKNRTMLGIWGEDSDEEDNRPGLGRGKSKKDYTAPIGFVSGGIKVGDKVTKEGGSDEEKQEDSDDEYDRQAMEMALARKQKYGKKGTFNMGDSHKEHSFGGWEKHTKGIGQKLLESMGYKAGSGLGKNLQGISTPVEAYKRKGKAAIGAYGTERTERSLKDYPTKPDSDEEEQKKFEQQMRQWKKGDGEKKKKKVKYVYKTADQLLSEGPSKKKIHGDQSHLSKVKVIDMTGKEQRVLSGYHAIGHKHEIPEEEVIPKTTAVAAAKAFEMPELLHNLDLLVDMAESEILQNDKKLRYEQDLVVNIRHEKEKSDEIVAYEEKQMEKLKRILELVERFEVDKNEGKMNLKDCGDMLFKLQCDFPDEYKIYDLWALSIALVFPLMKKEFDDWEPLKYPQRGISIIREWKKILEDPINRPYQGGEPHMEPYERLIWEVWMPPVRKATTEWVTRQPDNIIDVLDAWLELLPEWIVNNILEQIILPRLQMEVENWNPLTDTVPIHAWLHPWLPLMHDRLEPLYAPIRQKLSNALVNWHPSDPSAKLILEPWHGVFKDGHMNAFLLKNIMPKLMLCMQEFVINPHQQHLDAWNWVMAWQKLLPRIQMVTLLLKHFFPKWLQVLSTWLGSNPNFDEITKWYSGWKSMFSESLLSESQVKEEFNKALEMMNRAASGVWTPRDNMAYLQRPEGRSSPRPNPIPPLMPDTTYPGVKTVSGSNSLPGSFKDLVEKKAEANNLLFAPMPNKTWEAKQLYTFGKSQIYIDQGVVFRFDNMLGQFLPISLNTLIEKSK